jgi:hypothetical protein
MNNKFNDRIDDFFYVASGLVEEPYFNPNDSKYISSYPHLVAFSEGKEVLTESDFYQLWHMVYGWMPRIANHKFAPSEVNEIVKQLNLALNEGELMKHHFEYLKSRLDNSIVGVSKLLHFINPEEFAIWDSRVFESVFEMPSSSSRVNRVDRYMEYLDHLRNIRSDSRFKKIHKVSEKWVGYKMSSMRLIEMVYFGVVVKFD